MITADRARALALALPDATERDHHGRPSFRVAGKIFATLWDGEHLNVMLEPDEILTACQSRAAAATNGRPLDDRVLAAQFSLDVADSNARVGSGCQRGRDAGGVTGGKSGPHHP